jgi:multidrug efflux pump subunit AcrA (membrane-fusion protein)
MVNVVAQVDDPYGRKGGGKPPLTVGMFVDARIFGKVVEEAIVLPRSALRSEAQDRVWVIDDNNLLRFRDVTVLRAARDSVVITAGLAASERVCVSSMEAVTDGMNVRTETDATPPRTDDGGDGDAETAGAKGDRP